MKRKITYGLLAILIVVGFYFGLSLYSIDRITNYPRSKITHTITFDYMQGCETGEGDCNPVNIIRQSINDSVIVIFPSGGTQTDIYLYTETDFNKWMNGKSHDEPKALRHNQRLTDKGNPFLDLTGLPDGKYRPNMISCGLGGGFDLTITTKMK